MGTEPHFFQSGKRVGGVLQIVFKFRDFQALFFIKLAVAILVHKCMAIQSRMCRLEVSPDSKCTVAVLCALSRKRTNLAGVFFATMQQQTVRHLYKFEFP